MDHKIHKSSICSISFFFLLFLNSPVYCLLSYNFYDNTCPNLMWIVRSNVWSAIRNDYRMAASLLRLHFHDCFVLGCDGSVLLDDTSDFKGEKNALPNRNSARGFEVIEKIKTAVESVCPSTVSCADILTLAARDSVLMAGGTYYSVPLGRRDGTTASEDAANKQLPSPFASLQKITPMFTAKGLNLKDLVALSGAHSIGYAQCFTFSHRLSNFNNSSKPDPSLDSSLLKNLQNLCLDSGSANKMAPLDPITTYKFDNVFYKNLMSNSGLLQSDQSLMEDSDSASMVSDYSKDPNLFLEDFGASMVKMGNIGVLTGKNGQIRNKCNVVN